MLRGWPSEISMRASCIVSVEPPNRPPRRSSHTARATPAPSMPPCRQKCSSSDSITAETAIAGRSPSRVQCSAIGALRRQRRDRLAAQVDQLERLARRDQLRAIERHRHDDGDRCVRRDHERQQQGDEPPPRDPPDPTRPANEAALHVAGTTPQRAGCFRSAAVWSRAPRTLRSPLRRSMTRANTPQDGPRGDLLPPGLSYARSRRSSKVRSGTHRSVPSRYAAVVARNPTRIGRYDLITALATGGMGRIYLGRASGIGGFERKVVIKTLEVPLTAEADPAIAMFLDEARLLGLLHHQHIASVFEVGRDDDGRHFMVLDFVEGYSAHDVWERALQFGAALPLDFTLTVVSAAANGLHYAHTRSEHRRHAARHRASRRHAVERDDRPRRRGQADRLRDRDGGEPQDQDPDRLRQGQGRLPVARAGRRPRRRRAHRRVRARHPALRADDAAPRVSRQPRIWRRCSGSSRQGRAAVAAGRPTTRSSSRRS